LKCNASHFGASKTHYLIPVLHSPWQVSPSTLHKSLIYLLYIICLFPLSSTLHKGRSLSYFGKNPNIRTVPGMRQALNNYLLNEWKNCLVWSVIIYHTAPISFECQKTGSSPSFTLDIPRLRLK
jgi:hypothetical protein